MISRKLALPVALALTVAAATAPAWSVQDAASAAVPGQVNFKSDVVHPQIRAAEKPVMIAEGRAVGEAVVSRPALSGLRGYAIDWSVRVALQQQGMSPADPYPVRGFVLIRKVNLAARPAPQPDAQGRYPGEGEGPTLKFTVNDPFAWYWGNIEGAEPTPAQAAFDLPGSARWENGQMTVKTNGETTLVIGRTDRAPYVQMTREEYLRSLLAELPGNTALQAELAELSAAERASPACRGGREISRHMLTACTDPGSTYKVRVNPDYFDRTKPRTSTQLITFRVGDPAVGEDRDEGDKLRAAFSQIDVAAVRRLLD
jgi:hypothetical protein